MNVPHILIVDDEPGILDTCARALRRRGLEVTTASDAKTARILLQAKTVDMVVTDLRMPGESGISLLQTIHEITPDLPLMIITAYPDSASIDAALDLNVKSFIAKPFNISDFVSEVKRGLGLQEVQEEAISDLDELVPVIIEELRRRNVPVLEGRVRSDPASGRVVLIPEGSEGQVPVGEWLLGYTKGAPVYLIVLPRP